jgi:uncharacterized protein (UPF0332 family)
VDPRDFLTLAKKLIEEPDPSPAKCRTVIGRSYYAAFNVVAALVAELRIPLDKNKESHKQVMDLVVESKDGKLKTACDSLARQKIVRKHADYDMDNEEVGTVLKAARALLFAQSVIETVDQVRSNPVKWSVASRNIVDYARNILRKPI